MSKPKKVPASAMSKVFLDAVEADTQNILNAFHDPRVTSALGTNAAAVQKLFQQDLDQVAKIRKANGL